jgi:serine phosphatase RsbU (regulator of sigma subunit)
VGFRYEPASGGQVGGDWFQLINLDDDELVAVVGDAVGHGLTAAAAMGQLRSSIATAVSFDRDPAAALRNVDRFACSTAETLAATAVVTLIERDGTCHLASAGHVPPVLVRAGGTTTVLEEGRRPLLGFGDGTRRAPSYSTVLAAGDLIVLYSDGLVERRGELIDTGISRLTTLLGVLHGLPPQQMCDELVHRLANDGGTDDDIAVLLLRYVGAL